MSPFEIFRRNLKPLMVFLTLLALFAFVVLPAMDTYLRRGGGSGVDPQVAVFNGVPVTQSRVNYFTRNHQSTVRFLRKLAEVTIQRGGNPRTPGFVYDPQSKMIRSIGINEQPSELASIRTMQFAAEAEKAGLELDDAAIQTWLARFTDGTTTDSEIISLLMHETRNQMGKYHLYEQLRAQLLAELCQSSAMAGIVQRQLPIMTPAEQWTNFLKINQKATIDSYAVLVNDYIQQTSATPSEAEIESAYKEGIKRYPRDQSPEPGFRKRETATFEYLVADLKAFADREIENISEETLKAEYEKRLKGGEFQLPDEPEPPTEDESTEPEADSESGPAKADKDEDTDAESAQSAKDDAVKPDDAAAKEEMKKDAAGDAGNADSGGDQDKADSADDAPEKGKEDAEEAAKKEADQSAKNLEQLESFKKEIDAVREQAQQEEQQEAASEEQSSIAPATAVRLVAFQQDDDAADESADSEPDETSDTADQQQPAEESSEKADEKADDTDAAKESKRTDADKQDSKADADKADADNQDPKADEPTADVTDKKADKKTDDEPTAEKESDKPAEKSAGDADKAKAEPKVESFEDVRERIARSLAEPIARGKIEAALRDVENVMRRYFNEKAIYDSDVASGRKDAKKPTRPDLEALAKEKGMQYQPIGPHDVVTIGTEPISQSNAMGSQIGQRGPSFATMMFGVQSEQAFIPKQQLFSPLVTSDTLARRDYVSWKVAEEEARVPDLDEVRADVILAIRTKEARQLARAAAEAIAEKVNAGAALADAIPEDKKENLEEGLGPFSWMNSFGFQGAFLGNVPKLDSVGDDFMKSVFTTEIGKAGVAFNIPERVVYVVQPTGVQPHIDDLKEIFKQPQERMMALPLGSNDVRSILQGFYKAVDERTGFTYYSEDEPMQ